MIAHSEQRAEFQIGAETYAVIAGQEFGKLYIIIQHRQDDGTWEPIDTTKTQTATKGSELLFSAWAIVRKASKPINRLERKIGDVCKHYGHYTD